MGSVVSIRSGANSFQPYARASIPGDVSPTLRPRVLECQQFSMLVGLLVTLFVSIYGDPFGTFYAGAAGNMAQQYALLMTNHLYDWDAEREGLRQTLERNDT